MNRRARFMSASGIVILASAVFGCAEEAPDGPSFVRTDSLGIEIVESSSGSWRSGEEWEITPKPSLTLGVAEGPPELQLFRVQAAARLTDGSIAVVNAGTQSIKLFSPSGEYLKEIGRSGEGPGEFRYPTLFTVLPSDSMRVWDAGAWRMSWFDASGAFIRSETFSQRVWSLVTTEIFEPFGVGGYLVVIHHWGRDPPTGEVYRPPTGFGFIPADLSRVDTLGWYGGSEQVCLERTGCNTTILPHDTDWAVGGSPESLFVGDNAQPQIDVWSQAGELSRIIRFTPTPVPVSQDVLDRELERRRIWAEEHDQVQRDARLVAAMPLPESYPHFGDLIVDELGCLWLEAQGPAQATQPEYLIFDGEGVMLGSVFLPPSLRLLEIGEDYILAMRTDEFDLEYVDMFELQRDGSG